MHSIAPSMIIIMAVKIKVYHHQEITIIQGTVTRVGKNLRAIMIKLLLREFGPSASRRRDVASPEPEPGSIEQKQCAITPTYILSNTRRHSLSNRSWLTLYLDFLSILNYLGQRQTRTFYSCTIITGSSSGMCFDEVVLPGTAPVPPSNKAHSAPYKNIRTAANQTSVKSWSWQHVLFLLTKIALFCYLYRRLQYKR